MLYTREQAIAAVMAAKDDADVTRVEAFVDESEAALVALYVDWYSENNAMLSNTPATVKAAKMWNCAA